MSEKQQLTKEEATNALQTEILDSLQEVNGLLKELGHGEAKRLLLASLSYPLETKDFSNENDALRIAYSATKRIKDAMIALGVEVTLEAMLRQQLEENNNAPESTEGEKDEQN